MNEATGDLAVIITDALLRAAQDEAVEAILEAASAGFEPPPNQTVSEWADAHRVLTKRESPEPGKWKTSRTPYLRKIMDCLSIDSTIELVVFLKAAQIGGSEVGNNWLGYILSHPPAAAPTMVVLPTVDKARQMSRQRLEPLIAGVPAIRRSVQPKRSRDGGNTMLMKEFANGDGLLVLTGANSAAGLRAMSARFLFPDECEAYPADCEGEGPPLEILGARSSTFGRKGKTYIPSTPLNKEDSVIEPLFEETDQQRYFIPCPDCGHKDWIRWDRIKWEEGKPETAAMVCKECGVLIPESQKPLFLEEATEENPGGAEWIATAKGIPNAAGFALSALYSPLGWKSWEKCVRQFLKAKAATDHAALKTFTNTVLGETWEVLGETLEPDLLFARRERYLAPAPADVVCITAAIDVQGNRLELLAVGWARGETPYCLAKTVFWGDPETSDLVWEQADQWIDKRFRHESGADLPISCVCVDSSFATKTVYNWVQPRQDRRVFAVKGRAGEGLSVTSAPSKKTLGLESAGTVDLFTLGVDTAKGLIYSRLRLEEPGHGFHHFPVEDRFDQEFFAQLCAEKRVVSFHLGRPKRVWKKTRERNEALDLMVYNLAALYLLDPVWDALEENLKPRDEKAEAAAVTARQTKVNNWVNRWRDN